jgi:hypothetical protein
VIIHLTKSEIESHRADTFLPPDQEFLEEYAEYVRRGRELAAGKSVAFVAICRNAMPFLVHTLELVAKSREMFAHSCCYIFENDSTDGTKEHLNSATTSGFIVESVDNGRPHMNTTRSTKRTDALAEYREKCRRFVEEKCVGFDYVVVFDADPWGGFSVDGLATTICHLESPEYRNAVGMASYSWCEASWFGPVSQFQYDAFACRWNHWTWRSEMWFHLWHPPVGSRPVRMNSAFGQMAVYRRDDFVRGRYTGETCEHVTFHKSLGGEFYLNPSMRVVSFWIPDEQKETGGGLRSDLHQTLDGGSSDQSDRRDHEDFG